MEIILTHNNMDFDSLASQFALTKLYPTSRMVPGYPLVGNVREFLSLYRDTLPLVQLKYVDLKQVRHIYIVDCQHASRLDETARRLVTDPARRVRYTIFDHHQIDPDGLGPGASKDSIICPVGATTTLLVDEIRRRKVKLNPFEATLLAIGIYEDTGCLTYGGTTALDAECVAFLLREGADITRVAEYLHPKMSDAQIKLLEELLHHSRAVTVSGSKVVIAHSSMPRYLDGLASLTRKLVEIEAADAAVVVVRMRDRVHLVGRSDSPVIDIRSLMRSFGGDGHPGAGSAVTRKYTVEAASEKVEEILRLQARPERIAAQIMTTPVRTVRPRITMEEAGRVMLRYSLDGLTVVDEGKVVGVVSRRDIDQALHHKLGHAPVQGFMSIPVITISPDTPLSEIQRIMVTEDIGRLPVMDTQGTLVGIVSRSEVLETLYGQSSTPGEVRTLTVKQRRRIDFSHRLKSMDSDTVWLFTELGAMAEQLNMVAYAVGGCVRDLYLKRQNFDLDFVVEGSARDLAKALEEAHPGVLFLVACHDRFQTATVMFLHEGKRQEVDISTARMEFYEFPAALPEVEASSLEQDLNRRDFTINALAVCLNPGRFGELIDYFGGLDDLSHKTIRILHPFSFIEDPTRIVRAARFSARLGFHLDARSRKLAEEATSIGIFDDLGGVRMRTEIQLILESPNRLLALNLLSELGGNLRFLDSGMEYGLRERKLLRRAERLLLRFSVADDWIVYLGLLLHQLPLSQVETVMERLHLPNDAKSSISGGLILSTDLSSLSGNIRRSQIFFLLRGHTDLSLAIAACIAAPGSPLRRMIKLYFEDLRNVHITMTGAELLRMGLSQGPDVGRMLNLLIEAKLDGSVTTAQDERSFVSGRLNQGT